MGEGTARAEVARRGAGADLERLILDTTILIAAERTGLRLDDLIGDEDDVAIAAVTAAELLVGVELADASRRTGRHSFVEGLLESIPVEEYDLEVARVHAIILAHTRRSGRARGAHDLLIAATAASRRRIVVTADAAALDDLPGVEVRPAA